MSWWLKTKSGREKAVIIVPLVVAAISGVWKAFIYFFPKEASTSPRLKLEAKYTICVTDREERCPSGAVLVGCSDDPGGKAAKICKDFSLTQTTSQGGDMCRLAIYEMTCTSAE